MHLQLHKAAADGDVALVRSLLNRGASVTDLFTETADDVSAPSASKIR